jgi:hypothetical protein
MNELAVAIPAETQTQAAETTEPSVVASETTDPVSKPESAPAKTPEQIEVERLRRALTKRDRTQGQMHQEREQLRSELEQLRQRQPAPQAEPTQAQPVDRQVQEREVLSLAEKIAEQRAFAAKCNTVADAGKKEFPDFTEALNTLIEEAGPLVLPTGNATPLGEQVLDSDDPAKLIQYLGKHPEIAAELDGLSAGRIARKLALIEQQMDAKPKTSAAPKPLEPVSGKASAPTGYHKDMTDAQFAKWRQAQRSN